MSFLPPVSATLEMLAMLAMLAMLETLSKRLFPVPVVCDEGPHAAEESPRCPRMPPISLEDATDSFVGILARHRADMIALLFKSCLKD